MLLHRFLSGLQQAPRRKQPVDVRRRRHVLESFSGRLAPGVSDGWVSPLTPTALLAAAPPPQPALATNGNPTPSQSLHAFDAEPAHHAAGALYAGVSFRTGSTAADGSAPAAPPRSSAPEDMVHFQVDHVFEVQTVGTVLSGTTVRGCIELGTTLWWGPQDNAGEFLAVAVRGIHRSRVPVAKVSAGQCATIAVEHLPPPQDARRNSCGSPRRQNSPGRSSAGAAAAPLPGSPLVRTHSAAESPRRSAATTPPGEVAEARSGSVGGAVSEGADERPDLGGSMRAALAGSAMGDAGTPTLGSPSQLVGRLIPGTQGTPGHSLCLLRDYAIAEACCMPAAPSQYMM